MTGLGPANLRDWKRRWLKRWLAAAGKERQVYVQCARYLIDQLQRRVVNLSVRLMTGWLRGFSFITYPTTHLVQLSRACNLVRSDLSATRTNHIVSSVSRVARCSALLHPENLRSCVSIEVTKSVTNLGA